MFKSSLFNIELLGLILLVFVDINVLNAQSPVNNWSYIEIDNNNGKWGDYEEPDWLRYFGLDMGDLNGDGQIDILTGRTVYLNPGGNLSKPWTKVDLGSNIDGILAMDVDGDEFGDIIAQALPNVYWIEATNMEGTSWKSIKLGEIPATSHTNSQGFAKGQIIAGGKEEFLIAGDGDIYSFEIPINPEKNKWKITLVAANTSDEGIGLGDIDGDGDLDITAGRRPKGGDEPLVVVWYENPGDGTPNWKNYIVGKTNNPADRFAIADMDGDNKADIIVTEERYPGLEPDGNLFWYEQPEIRTNEWQRNRVVTQYSMNNLDVKDMDHDGDMDIITSEHKGSKLELQLWENDGKGIFGKKILDEGKESHLGTQVEDMDGDGDLDIVSIGWDEYRKVHLWRNDDISKETRNWKLYSTSTADFEVPNSGNQQTASLVLDADNDGIMDFFISERTATPALVWYRYVKNEWKRYVVEDGPLRIEAGSAAFDIDGDGDQDIVFGGDGQSNEVWWWENPYPNYNPLEPWKRYTIKKSGAKKHHDQMFGDFNGDGTHELVFWNQGGARLILAEIPDSPKDVEEWPLHSIYQYSNDSQMEPLVGFNGYPDWSTVNEHEGLFKTDIDGDGIEDIVGGGRWFKYHNGRYMENIIDASYTFSRSVAGQFIEGGRPEVIVVVGDGKGPMNMYEWINGTWKKTELLKELDNGHTLDVLDFNGDGKLDIFSAEMRFGDGNPNTKVRILLGNGKGHFKEMTVVKGYGVHEGRIVDLDGDGDYDVLGKPYTWKAPLINMWINEGPKIPTNN